MALREWIRTHLKGDRQIWWIVLYLSIMSILVVYSATGTKAFRELDGNTEAFLFKHGSLLLIGVGLHVFCPQNQLRVLCQIIEIWVVALHSPVAMGIF